METYPQPSNILERFNRWIEESITVKLVSIGFLVLILLIPSAWIQSLMEERELRAGEVINEVSSKWSGPQTLSGPILVIPYKREVSRTDHAKGTVEITETIENYYFLPEKLDIKGDIQPEELHRGIFDVAVYSSALALNSTFVKPDFKSLGISEDKVLWKDAHMIFSISDLRGISDNPVFKIGGVDKSTEPSNQLGITFNGLAGDYAQPGVENSLNNTSSGIIARLGWLTSDDFKESTAVSINLKGSQQLSFVPTGKTTTVKLEGKWEIQVSMGEFLPVDRSVSESAFSANWKILHYNRPFAQQWTRSTASFSGYEFGVKLLVPVDQYQKSIRTSKYGQLIIILTFVALFLVEITKKIRIHPFQYILIGVALIIYYTLLLSLSEQVGYNIAYWISAASTVGLISFYSTSFLKSTNLVVLFTSLLAIFYTFIFIIILQQDFSLLLGSIGLFMIVGALMYFSRKVEWYK